MVDQYLRWQAKGFAKREAKARFFSKKNVYKKVVLDRPKKYEKLRKKLRKFLY